MTMTPEEIRRLPRMHGIETTNFVVVTTLEGDGTPADPMREVRWFYGPANTLDHWHDPNEEPQQRLLDAPPNRGMF